MEAAEYDRMDAAEQGMWWYRALHARLGDALAPVTDGPVLDAGCGTGGLLAYLAQRFPDLATIGVEFAPAAARAAAKSARPVARGSINALPFAEGRFAAAIAADVLCHGAVDPVRALAELHRVLRPDGLLIVNMPAYGWLLSAHDRAVHNTRRVTRGALAAMLAGAGFTAIRAGYWNSLLLPLMIAHRLAHRGDGGAGSDVAPFRPWLDRALHRMTEIERQRAWPWPAGGSVLAIARRPA
ncbi:MAG: class I SAM-dependent methyltransferase [Rhodospirillales bacterium]|nr:class I SAM-dependent methyltransferase [Rhodospirillales bacterium]